MKILIPNGLGIFFMYLSVIGFMLKYKNNDAKVHSVVISMLMYFPIFRGRFL